MKRAAGLEYNPGGRPWQSNRLHTRAQIERATPRLQRRQVPDAPQSRGCQRDFTLCPATPKSAHSPRGTAIHRTKPNIHLHNVYPRRLPKDPQLLIGQGCAHHDADIGCGSSGCRGQNCSGQPGVSEGDLWASLTATRSAVIFSPGKQRKTLIIQYTYTALVDESAIDTIPRRFYLLNAATTNYTKSTLLEKKKMEKPALNHHRFQESETCHHAKSQPTWMRMRLPAGGNQFTKTIAIFLLLLFVCFRVLPVRTPTRIWWSWFVKIIPSDAMFNSAVTRTENSRLGPEPSASNLGWRGRERARGGGRGDGWCKGEKKRRADKMSGKPSEHRGHPQIYGQDAGAV